MERGGCTPAQIDRFVKRVECYKAGNHGLVPESDLRPVQELPTWESLPQAPELMRRAVILALNGGLGTSMGLTGPKGLLQVKGEKDFYAIMLDQLDAHEERDGFRPPLVFMNSFATEKATTERLQQLGFQQELPWSFLQSQVPKIDEEGRPVEVDEEYAWCPPGHGDLYASLLDSGLRDRLVQAGYHYLFVSNIDNLGAVLDSRPLGYMHEHGIPFLMEVTRRGAEDRKGGHLAQSPEGNFLLREVAQCPEEDLDAFTDVAKHRYFNTNNLWVDLRAIDESWTELPLIVNRKPVIPHQVDSPVVSQLETAMGAAIGTVKGARAIEVGRDRFFPVKTTNELLAIRSDLYDLDAAGLLHPLVEKAPKIDLDPHHYKMIADFDRLVEGAPSLKECTSLKVRGPVVLSSEDRLVGEVILENSGSDPKRVGELTSP